MGIGIGVGVFLLTEEEVYSGYTLVLFFLLVFMNPDKDSLEMYMQARVV